MSEHQLIREIDRGRQAQAVVESPIFREAVDGLRDQLLGDWRATAPKDTQGREQLWLAQRLLQQIEAHLTQVMTTGVMASLQIDRDRTLKQRAADLMRGRWE